MEYGYVPGLESKSVIFGLIEKGKYEEALKIAEKRFHVTEKIYELPPYIALRKKIYGPDDVEALKLESRLIRFGKKDDIASLGSSYKETGQYEDAITVFESILESQQFNDAYPRLIELYTITNNQEKLNAIQQKYGYDKEETNRMITEILNYRDTTMDQLGTKAKLEELLQKDSTYSKAKYELARIELGLRNFEVAEKYFTELIEDAYDFELKCNYIYYLAKCKYDNQNASEAQRILSEVNINTLNNNPEMQIRYYHLLIGCNFRLNRFPLALEYIEAVLELRKEPGTYETKSAIHRRLNQPELAEQAILEAIKLNKNVNYEQIFNYVTCLIKLGKYEEAEKHLEICCSDLDFVAEYNKEINNVHSIIQFNLYGREKVSGANRYFVKQVIDYDPYAAIEHIKLHKEETTLEKEKHSIFLPEIDATKLFYEVKALIQNKTPGYYAASDEYYLKMPYPVAVIDGYETNKITVVTLLNTKQIVTIYPQELTIEEKQQVDREKTTKVVSSRQQMSASDRFKAKWGFK